MYIIWINFFGFRLKVVGESEPKDACNDSHEYASATQLKKVKKNLGLIP